MAVIQRAPMRPSPLSGRPGVARILVACLPLQFAFGLVYAWGAVAPFVARERHWPALLISAVFSATPIGYGTGVILGGRLADRLPPRRLCWAGVVLLAAGGGTALAFPTEVTFIVCYSMLGMGLGGGLALAGSVAAGRHALPGRPGYVGGLVTAAYAVAAPIQVPLASLLAQSVGWLTGLRLLVGGMLMVAAITLALMPSVPARDGTTPASGHASATALAVASRPRVISGFLLQVLATPLGAYAFVAAATYARGLGLGALAATVAISGVALGNAFGRVAGGALSDRFGVDRVMLAILAADVGAGGALFAARQPVLVVAAALLAGVGFGAPAGIIGRVAEDAAPDAPGTAFGLVFAGFAVGAGSGSLLGAALGGRLAWAVLAIFAAAGLVVIAVRLGGGRPRVS